MHWSLRSLKPTPYLIDGINGGRKLKARHSELFTLCLSASESVRERAVL